jgi:hypothetical protein
MLKCFQTSLGTAFIFQNFSKKKNCLLENRNTYGDDFQLNQQPRSIRSGRAGLQFRVVLASSDSPKDQIV